MTIAEKITRAKSDYDAVYEAGIKKGAELGDYFEGFEAGKKSQYDEFWDVYQDKGKRTHYARAFCGFGWSVDNFKPKYNIVPEHATGMFNQFAKRIDLVSHLESIGITVDISQAVNADDVFYNAYFTRIGVVDFTGCKKMANAFSYCNFLTTIDKIIVSEECTFYTPFVNCKVLEEVRFEGGIGKNGLSLQYSTVLSKASITSIINCLKYIEVPTEALYVTLSAAAVKKAFETSEGANDGNESEEWLNLAASKPMWSISLI